MEKAHSYGIDTFWDDFENYGDKDTDPEDETEAAWYMEEEDSSEEESLEGAMEEQKKKMCLYCKKGNCGLVACTKWQAELSDTVDRRLKEDLATQESNGGNRHGERRKEER